MYRLLTGFFALLAVVLAVSFPATARTRVIVGVGIGTPYYYGPHYYAPPPYYYYPPAPAYYYPPAPYYAPAYAPAPAYYAPPAYAPAAPGPAPAAYCREYRGDATIDGSDGQPFYGKACREADGQWHIVN